jgi:MFS family permease
MLCGNTKERILILTFRFYRLIESTIMCASQNIGMLIVGCIINGLCVGIESAQVPVYISEMSPPSKRGRFVGVQQWAITWGILIMF